MPAEDYLLAKHIPGGLDILDVGVGAGRTTAFLAPQAGRYLGIDYSTAMIEACRRRFPAFEFRVADAADLSFLPDGGFDIAFFSFNGIDYLPTDAGRASCLRELRRVTRPGGRIIISSHNARVLALYPQLAGATLLRKAWRLARSFALSGPLALKMLRSKAYRDGSGYIFDPVHGGLQTHVSTPSSIARDAASAGLEIVEIVGGCYPRRVPDFLNPWNTYVLQRAGTCEESR
jgi:SAM-dependent methyltransferase